MFQDYNNNRVEADISSAAAAALATHDYTNRSLASAAEDRCFPCTYQGCVKVFILFKMLLSDENSNFLRNHSISKCRFTQKRPTSRLIYVDTLARNRSRARGPDADGASVDPTNWQGIDDPTRA